MEPNIRRLSSGQWQWRKDRNSQWEKVPPDVQDVLSQFDDVQWAEGYGRPAGGRLEFHKMGVGWIDADSVSMEGTAATATQQGVDVMGQVLSNMEDAYANPSDENFTEAQQQGRVLAEYYALQREMYNELDAAYPVLDEDDRGYNPGIPERAGWDYYESLDTWGKAGYDAIRAFLDNINSKDALGEALHYAQADPNLVEYLNLVSAVPATELPTLDEVSLKARALWTASQLYAQKLNPPGLDEKQVIEYAASLDPYVVDKMNANLVLNALPENADNQVELFSVDDLPGVVAQEAQQRQANVTAETQQIQKEIREMETPEERLTARVDAFKKKQSAATQEAREEDIAGLGREGIVARQLVIMGVVDNVEEMNRILPTLEEEYAQAVLAQQFPNTDVGFEDFVIDRLGTGGPTFNAQGQATYPTGKGIPTDAEIEATTRRQGEGRIAEASPRAQIQAAMDAIGLNVTLSQGDVLVLAPKYQEYVDTTLASRLEPMNAVAWYMQYLQANGLPSPDDVVDAQGYGYLFAKNADGTYLRDKNGNLVLATGWTIDPATGERLVPQKSLVEIQNQQRATEAQQAQRQKDIAGLDLQGILQREVGSTEINGVLQVNASRLLPLFYDEYQQALVNGTAKAGDVGFQDFVRNRIATKGRPSQQEEHDYYVKQGLGAEHTRSVQLNVPIDQLPPLPVMATRYEQTPQAATAEATKYRQSLFAATPTESEAFRQYLQSPEVQAQLQSEVQKQQQAEMDAYGKSIFGKELPFDTATHTQPLTETQQGMLASGKQWQPKQDAPTQA
ncbi:MAG: hypothetical protein ABIH46_12625, partial [Chloroflexota bacterium]